MAAFLDQKMAAFLDQKMAALWILKNCNIFATVKAAFLQQI
jgi:hypothetical protein